MDSRGERLDERKIAGGGDRLFECREEAKSQEFNGGMQSASHAAHPSEERIDKCRERKHSKREEGNVVGEGDPYLGFLPSFLPSFFPSCSTLVPPSANHAVSLERNMGEI